ncbi:MAG: hypothetical protein AAFR38_01565 [Planctomycetota bacterium]
MPEHELPHLVRDDTPDDGMFLTPRVLDHTAFQKYAESLRAIVAEASQRTRGLIDEVESASGAAVEARDATQALRERMEVAVRLIPTLDQRATKAAELIEQAETKATTIEQDHSESLRAFEAQLEHRVAEAVGRAEARAAAAMEGVLGRVAEAEARADRAVDGVLDRIADAETRADRASGSMLERVEAAEARAAQAQAYIAELERSLAETESRLERALAAQASIAEPIDRAATRMGEIADSMDAVGPRIDALAERAQTVIDEAATERLEALRESAEATIAMLSDRTADAAGVAARLEAVLGSGSGSVTTRLGAIVEAAQSADSATDRLETIARQADEARGVLSASLLEAVDHIDRLDTERDRLVRAIASSIEAAQMERPEIEASLEEVEGRMERVRETQRELSEATGEVHEAAQAAVETLASRTGEIHRMIDDAVEDGMAKAEQVGAWLTRVIAKANEAAKRAEASSAEPEVAVIKRRGAASG